MAKHPKPQAWTFWQRSQAALDNLTDVMQQLATVVDEPMLQMPRHTVRRVNHAMADFQQNFALLVREQKRKTAAR